MKGVLITLAVLFSINTVIAKGLDGAPVTLMKVNKEVLATHSGLEINVSSSDLSWRLVHDGANSIDLFESGGKTYTKNNLELFVTEAEALARVKALGLVDKREPIMEKASPVSGK